MHVGNVVYRLELPPFAPNLVAEVIALAGNIFGKVNPGEFEWRLVNLPDPSLAVASDARDFVGFKCGYAVAPGRYYSWLGGVAVHSRRLGVARSLMELQHSWLAERGYSSVETGTIDDNEAMLKLNREFGFKVIGSYNRHGEPQVLLAKRFASLRPRAA